MVLLSVSFVREISHDLVDIHSHLRLLSEKLKGIYFTLSTSDQRYLAPHNFLNAGNVLRGIKARMLALHVSSR